MNLKIKYFGVLAEITQCQEETYIFTQTKVSELLNELFHKYPLLKEKKFQVAQNQKIVTLESAISEAEIALLPPFSGG